MREDDDPEWRLILLALVARITAQPGDRTQFGAAWWDAWEAIRDQPVSTARECAVLDLAHAATAAQDRPRALGLVGLIAGESHGVNEATRAKVDVALAPLGIVADRSRCDST